jgi:hypothetical protein
MRCELRPKKKLTIQNKYEESVLSEVQAEADKTLTVET